MLEYWHGFIYGLRPGGRTNNSLEWNLGWIDGSTIKMTVDADTARHHCESLCYMVSYLDSLNDPNLSDDLAAQIHAMYEYSIFLAYSIINERMKRDKQ